MLDSRHILRQQLRKRRQALGKGSQLAAANNLVSAVVRLGHYARAKNIACYLASDGELDCRFVIEQLWRDGKQCFLPIVTSKDGAPYLEFKPYRPGQSLMKNRYGILEPCGGRCLSAQVLDMVLVPLVGFDYQGNRLGMGGGYYDRSFAFSCQTGKPLLFGVAHRCQRVPQLQAQPWDVPMQGILAV